MIVALQGNSWWQLLVVWKDGEFRFYAFQMIGPVCLSQPSLLTSGVCILPSLNKSRSTNIPKHLNPHALLPIPSVSHVVCQVAVVSPSLPRGQSLVESPAILTQHVNVPLSSSSEMATQYPSIATASSSGEEEFDHV